MYGVTPPVTVAVAVVVSGAVPEAGAAATSTVNVDGLGMQMAPLRPTRATVTDNMRIDSFLDDILEPPSCFGVAG
jgi:hypothetical protein